MLGLGIQLGSSTRAAERGIMAQTLRPAEKHSKLHPKCNRSTPDPEGEPALLPGRRREPASHLVAPPPCEVFFLRDASGQPPGEACLFLRDPEVFLSIASPRS